MAEYIQVEVAYASPTQQKVVSLQVLSGCCAEQAIALSTLLDQFPDIPKPLVVGIFGRVCALDQVLADGDRVEIYRPLQANPKERRRQRAERAKK